ncbi:mitochondrial calcium uniporter regulator 1-like [Lethenteron reissneri]|uniref:mitochondrial calcium uniporter regulator 1-like n=1 Tax=Lethenteron reissneri TaxID=7753 RepID=UPI002AB61C6C|nr:mitochondrial calcium uniporter regulator 1-like [Lethenteron reissneri]XP_061421679.1 mitochondrial calcium uniporter regulator 1-like [Lethenteron reissneri]
MPPGCRFFRPRGLLASSSSSLSSFATSRRFAPFTSFSSSTPPGRSLTAVAATRRRPGLGLDVFRGPPALAWITSRGPRGGGGGGGGDVAAPSRGFRTAELRLSYDLRQVDLTSTESRKFHFDTHAMVCLLESNGFTTGQAEVLVAALVKILSANMEAVYREMVTKSQQEIMLQQVMAHLAAVKKDMIILEKSEFSALRNDNEKMKIELIHLKKHFEDEFLKVKSDAKLDMNLEKSRVKEMFSDQEKKLLEMRTEIVELHAEENRALTNTNNRIDTEIAGLKTILESNKLDTIKYLAASVFTCLTIALGFYRLWS